MDVVVIGCDAYGDVDDLRVRAKTGLSNLAAEMITYPLTHSVFRLIGGRGGSEVYLDISTARISTRRSASSAQAITAPPSATSILHKTVCIAHSGGPGNGGPISVRAHLAPLLPRHAAEYEPLNGIAYMAMVLCRQRHGVRRRS